jgi:hypothetical protein
MKYCFLLVSAFLLMACTDYKDYGGVEFEEKNPRDWENPLVNEINKEAPRAWFVPFANPEEVDRNNIWDRTNAISPFLINGRVRIFFFISEPLVQLCMCGSMRNW